MTGEEVVLLVQRKIFLWPVVEYKYEVAEHRNTQVKNRYLKTALSVVLKWMYLVTFHHVQLHLNKLKYCEKVFFFFLEFNSTSEAVIFYIHYKV